MTAPFKKAFLFLFASFLSISLLAQADSIDIFIQQQMQKRKIPGLQLAIVRHGQLIKSGNYGLANVQDSIPVSDKSLFTINSITKAFTGVAIMQLVEAGKLNLSSPVSAYLPDLPQGWQKVTVMQLLSHTSGIPDMLDEEESVLIAPTPEAAWKHVVTQPMDFVPGEMFRYNQTNYLLLGRIVDTLSGMSFQEFISKEQLQKAGMEKTIRAGFGATKEIVPNAAGGYRYAKGKLTNMFFALPPELQTAAGMSSTAKEMAAWVIALRNKQLLKTDAAMTALWTPALLNSGKTSGFSNLLNGYAAGWPVIARDEHPAAAAVGGIRSAVFVYPKDDLSIIVLTNLAGGSPETFIDELAGFFLPDMKEANGFGFSPAVKPLWLALEKRGYQHAVEEARKLRKKGIALDEAEINGWGYKLMGQGRMRDALAIFQLNVYLYPESANTYDSLGEIYAELDEMALAVEAYEQSLKLNPKNGNAVIMLERLKANR